MRTTNVTATMQFTAQTATHQRIFVYHNQRGRRTTTTKRRDTREAQVTIITEDCARRVVTKTVYWQTRSIARFFCDSIATCRFTAMGLYIIMQSRIPCHGQQSHWGRVPVPRFRVIWFCLLYWGPRRIFPRAPAALLVTCPTALYIQTQKCMAVDWRT